VSRRLGPTLRRQGDTEDGVQDAVLEVLRCGPRFLPRDREQFCGLVARLVENLLRDRAEWLTAQKREYRREQPWSRESVLVLDPAAREATSDASGGARRGRGVGAARARAADPADRRIVRQRLGEKLREVRAGKLAGARRESWRVLDCRTRARAAPAASRVVRSERIDAGSRRR